MMLVEGAYAAAPYLGNEEAANSLERSGQLLIGAALPAAPAG
jgi:hypothetical protein